jgi:hypothetical protein
VHVLILEVLWTLEVWRFFILKCSRDETPEVPKSEVNCDRPLARTRVGRLQTVRTTENLGDKRCGAFNPPEARKSIVNLDHS